MLERRLCRLRKGPRLIIIDVDATRDAAHGVLQSVPFDSESEQYVLAALFRPGRSGMIRSLVS